MNGEIKLSIFGGDMVSTDKVLKNFAVIKQKAESVLKDSNQVASLVQAAMAKIAQSGPKINTVKTDLKDLLEMLRGYLNGSYTNIPWKSLVAITAGIIYFVNPLDLIPDFMAGVGFLDDIKVIELVLRQVHTDLSTFRKHKGSV